MCGDDDFIEPFDVGRVDWVESVGDNARGDRLVVFSDGEALPFEYWHPIHRGQLGEKRNVEFQTTCLIEMSNLTG